MQVSTKIGYTKRKEWSVRIHTRRSVFPSKGNFFTVLSLGDNPRSNGILLVTQYTQSEEEAAQVHLEIASKAKTLFDLVK